MNRRIITTGIVGLIGLVVGWVVATSVARTGFTAARVQHDNSQAAVNLNRDIRLLDAIKKGQLGAASFLLEMDLDSSIITLYTAQERSALSEACRKALQSGVDYRKANAFVRTNNGVDRAELVEITIERILRGEPVSKDGTH
jgi:hypothetical protein